MFGKKKPIEITKRVRQTKEEELGPKPADIPNTRELVKFQILLKHSLPSIEVTAHEHDFGKPVSCDKPRTGEFTHFIVHGDTTWRESHEYLHMEHSPLMHGLSHEVRKWKWVKQQQTSVVFSIRTTDIVMVVAKENFTPVETETLALEPRHKPEPMNNPMMSAPIRQFDDADLSGPAFIDRGKWIEP